MVESGADSDLGVRALTWNLRLRRLGGEGQGTEEQGFQKEREHMWCEETQPVWQESQDEGVREGGEARAVQGPDR